MAIKITVDATDAINHLSRIKTKFPIEVRSAGEESAKQTSYQVRANLMQTVARKRAGPLWQSITYSPGVSPKSGQITDIAQSYSNIQYAEQIELGYLEMGLEPVSLSPSQIGDWWQEVVGTYPTTNKMVNPSYGRGAGQRMFRKALPFAEQRFLSDATERMNEVVK